jgi:DNA-binding transcriptional ArsR family regulator
MVKHSPGALDAIFAALADPTRRAIIEQLTRGDSSVSALAEPHDMSLPAISKHLRVLEKAGLILCEKEGRVHRMQLASAPLRDATAWLDRYRRFWEEQFDALDGYLLPPKHR